MKINKKGVKREHVQTLLLVVFATEEIIVLYNSTHIEG